SVSSSRSLGSTSFVLSPLSKCGFVRAPARHRTAAASSSTGFSSCSITARRLGCSLPGTPCLPCSFSRPGGTFHPASRVGFMNQSPPSHRGAEPMPTVEERLKELGLVLPEPLQMPPGVTLPFPWVRVVGSRALISGHGPTNADGSLAQPLGKVGTQVSVEQAYAAAKLTGLAILGSLKRELGGLERIAGWNRVFGMVNSAPGFNRQPAVINGFSELILSVF